MSDNLKLMDALERRGWHTQCRSADLIMNTQRLWTDEGEPLGLTRDAHTEVNGLTGEVVLRLTISCFNAAERESAKAMRAKLLEPRPGAKKDNPFGIITTPGTVTP